MATTKIVKGLCFGCPSMSGCGVLFHVEDGKLVSVKGDTENPINKGTICDKAVATPEVIYHSERLKYPLKRDGERGEGKWKRISWDEALTEMAANFQKVKDKYGPEAVAISSGTSSILLGVNWYIGLFLHLFGSPNHLRASHI